MLRSEIVAIPMVRNAVNRFIKMPWKIYRSNDNYDKNWVPPLLLDEKVMFNPRKYPLYSHIKVQLFLAIRDGQPLGRIAAIRDENFIKMKGQQTGFFGFFECINDQEMASQLLDSARNWCKEQGCEQLIGPVNLTPNIVLGLLVDNFSEPPVVQTPYNPKYYQDLICADSWTKAFDFYAYRYDRDKHILPEKAFRVAELVRIRNRINVRKLSKKSWKEDVHHILEIWNQTWLTHPEFVPWDRADFMFLANNLKNIINEDFTQLAFIDDEPVAFSLPLPNVNEALIKGNGRLTPLMIIRLLRSLKKGKYLRIAVVGVKERYQKQGIESLFLTHIQKIGVEKDYRYGDMSMIVDSNVKLLRMLDNLQYDRYRTYRIYTKKVDE